MTSVNNVTSTVNETIVSQILTKAALNNDSEIQSLFDDGEKVFNDSASDANTNRKVIDSTRKTINNSKSNDAATQKMAHKRADYVKSGSVLYDTVATGKAVIKGNKATIQVKDKNGKAGTAVFTYASDGSYMSSITVGDVTTERIVDKNGKMREMVVKNKKSTITVTNEYDASGKINTQTETDSKRPNWKLTRYCDDNGKRVRNVVNDGTRTYTTDFEHDKNGKVVAEQIRSYYNSDPATVYYRTNIFEDGRKTSIDNNPDGSRSIAEYVFQNGEWNATEIVGTKPDGTVEKRTIENKEDGQKLAKVETTKNGKTKTEYNLQTFDEKGRHIKTSVYSDENLKNKTADIEYTYNKDDYLEKTEITDYTNNKNSVTNYDSKTGKTVSSTKDDLLTADSFKTELDKGVKEGKITEEEAQITEKYLERLDNFQYSISYDHDTKSGGHIWSGGTLTLENFANANLGKQIGMTYNGKTYVAQSEMDSGYLTKYYEVMSDGTLKELKNDDKIIEEINYPLTDSDFSKAIMNGSVQFFVESDSNDKSSFSVTVDGKKINFEKKALEEFKNIDKKLSVYDDGVAQVEHNTSMNKIAQQKTNDILNQKVKEGNLSYDSASILRDYLSDMSNSVLQSEFKINEVGKDGKMQENTIKKDLSLASLAQEQVWVQSHGVNADGTVKEGSVDYLTNKIAFFDGNNTYIAKATYNENAKNDSDKFKMEYWIADTNGKEQKLSENDSRIQNLNSVVPDSIIQKSAKDGLGKFYREVSKENAELNSHIPCIKIGDSYYLETGIAPRSMTTSRNYTEDDALALQKYNNRLKALSENEQNELNKTKTELETELRQKQEYLSSKINHFIKYTTKRYQ